VLTVLLDVINHAPLAFAARHKDGNYESTSFACAQDKSKGVLSFFLDVKQKTGFRQTMNNALAMAKRQIGGAKALADALGNLTPQAVSQWARVPATRVLEVERVTKVPRFELRPDLYPPPQWTDSDVK